METTRSGSKKHSAGCRYSADISLFSAHAGVIKGPLNYLGATGVNPTSRASQTGHGGGRTEGTARRLDANDACCGRGKPIFLRFFDWGAIIPYFPHPKTNFGRENECNAPLA